MSAANAVAAKAAVAGETKEGIMKEFTERLAEKMAEMALTEGKGSDEPTPYEEASGKATAKILSFAGTAGKCVVILHGPPGAGKSRFVTKLKANGKTMAVCSADDYFTDKDGVYKFNPRQLRFAHADCLEKFKAAIADEDVKIVVVDNTNTKTRDYKDYLTALPTVSVVFRVKKPADIEVVAERNNHGVSYETVARMCNTIQANEKLPKKDTDMSDTYSVINVPVYIK